MAAGSPLRLAFYGDDFTGSTDALEALSRAGLRTLLFVAAPTPERLAQLGPVDAIGVAGVTRSLAPALMVSHLRGELPALRGLGPRHVHYKVCSTFDSSPTVGSVGCAIDEGAEIFRHRFVPLVVGAPGLGRYCVFGNLFARMGIGSDGAIFRLDRHPSMSRHPVTPADESDLRLHLAKQTRKRIGLVDVLALDGTPDTARAALERELSAGSEIVLFDALTDGHLAQIGRLLEAGATAEAGPLFSVGSSAVESALVAHWRAEGSLPAAPNWPSPGEAKPLLVVSGSCSPVTSAQIQWAVAHGFVEVAFDVQALLTGNTAAMAAAESDARRALAGGRHVVLHTQSSTTKEGSLGGEERAGIGATLGGLARNLVGAVPVTRLVVAGGDTSSYAATTLGIAALEMIAPLVPGAPLCRARAPGSPIDGLEVNFKGGQVGAPDYFGLAANPSRT